MHFAEYGLFLAKTVTIVIAILVIAFALLIMAAKNKIRAKEKLEVKKFNEKYQEMRHTLNAAVLSKHEMKAILKEEKKTEKYQKSLKTPRKKIYVIHFHGDIRASAVRQLREEITGILMIATSQDEVVVCIESHGGIVHNYGLASSELARLRQHNISLTVIVDKIAASGGYMMASVANRIIAAPFAIIGSIGVIAQLPNFHRLLKKNNIEFEQIMAGEYKRTLTMFGENTEKGREKLQEEVDEIHTLFKRFIAEYRPQLNIDKVATGEHWYGSQALQLNLIDTLMTSDDYLLNASKSCDIYKICYATKKTLSEKISKTAQMSMDRIIETCWQQEQQTRYQ